MNRKPRRTPLHYRHESWLFTRYRTLRRYPPAKFRHQIRDGIVSFLFLFARDGCRSLFYAGGQPQRRFGGFRNQHDADDGLDAPPECCGPRKSCRPSRLGLWGDMINLPHRAETAAPLFSLSNPDRFSRPAKRRSAKTFGIIEILRGCAATAGLRPAGPTDPSFYRVTST